MNPIAILKRGGAAGLAAAVLVLCAGTAQAGKVEGVWWSNVTRVDCATGAAQLSFTGMQVYHQGGTLTDTNSGNPASRGPGMGTWKREGQDVHTRFRFMLFNGGTFTGTAVVTRVITLTPDGDSATGRGTSEVYAPDGTLVATSCTRDVSTRVN